MIVKILLNIQLYNIENYLLCDQLFFQLLICILIKLLIIRYKYTESTAYYLVGKMQYFILLTIIIIIYKEGYLDHDKEIRHKH